MLNVKSQDFDAEVIKNATPVVVDFWAPWCGPCKSLAPTFDELAEQYGEKVKFVKVNIDDEPETARQFGVRGVPTLLFFKEGATVDRLVGNQSKPAISAVLDRL